MRKLSHIILALFRNLAAKIAKKSWFLRFSVNNFRSFPAFLIIFATQKLLQP